MSILAIGVMSGTSLDGVDIALCRFTESEDDWAYEIIDAQTVSYSNRWIEKLRNAHHLTAFEFLLLHNEYGIYVGKLIQEFLQGKEIPQLIASHGHTIFHQPDKKLTFQLGNGASIAAITGITTVSDFRNFDVSLGGQGAPLVPVGDKLLFKEFDYCLNIGGFANISFEEGKTRLAFDICPANIVLNEFAHKNGKPFDEDGQLGASGTVNNELLKKLDNLDYYLRVPPKSLGREWSDNHIIPLLSNSGISIEDQAATFYEHIADQISRATYSGGKILVTGGGAKNKYLIRKLKSNTLCQIILPCQELIDYKEALIFAFLGVRAVKREVNVLSSVTGACRDHIGGIIYCV